MTTNQPSIIKLEEGLEITQHGITKLKNSIEGLLKPQFSYDEYMSLYTTIYNMCTQNPPHNYSLQLYNTYQEAFKEYIRETVLPSLREKDGESMLRELVQRWSNHKSMVRWLSRFFYYLDYFCTRRFLPGLNEVGIKCFRDLVYEEIKVKVRDVVLSQIYQEREGEQIDTVLLKNVIGIFVEIGMGHLDCHATDFEAEMLLQSSTYYSLKASRWILDDSCLNCLDYLLKAEQCLKCEKDRAPQYLHPSSVSGLLEKVHYALSTVFTTQLLENKQTGFLAFLSKDKVEDLTRMYRLFLEIPKVLDPVAKIFEKHIIAEGMTLVKQAEDGASHKKADKKHVRMHEQVFVRKVIELHAKYLAFIEDYFQKSRIFHEALKKAFENFFNKGVAGSSTPELLATFCDIILNKEGSEKLSDEVTEETLEKAVELLAYISDKDLFAELYRRKLARRLLFDKRTNYEHQRSILTKLKGKYGYLFTSKMEGMLSDLTLSKENQTDFEEYLSENPVAKPGIDLTVTVLNAFLWPRCKSFNLNLPPEMVKCVEVFSDFYQRKTRNRKLTWIDSLGTCNMSGHFEQKTIELIVTTSQACTLLLFNTSNRLSYQEIVGQLNLSDKAVVKLLHSLSCAKYKILKKEPSTEAILPSDMFEFNSQFTDKMSTIKVPLPHTSSARCTSG